MGIWDWLCRSAAETTAIAGAKKADAEQAARDKLWAAKTMAFAEKAKDAASLRGGVVSPEQLGAARMTVHGRIDSVSYGYDDPQKASPAIKPEAKAGFWLNGRVYATEEEALEQEFLKDVLGLITSYSLHYPLQAGTLARDTKLRKSFFDLAVKYGRIGK